jgi:hypothetical protein
MNEQDHTTANQRLLRNFITAAAVLFIVWFGAAVIYLVFT